MTDIDGFRKAEPPAVPSAGEGPKCDDANFWQSSTDPKESTIEEIEKGFNRK